jgi:hypothetical protein
MAWATIVSELLGGLAILLGAFVSIISLPLAMLLLVAIFTVHLPYGFASIKLMSVIAGRPQFGPPGYECDLLYLACLVALVLGGSGPMAIDDYLKKKDRLRLIVKIDSHSGVESRGPQEEVGVSARKNIHGTHSGDSWRSPAGANTGTTDDCDRQARPRNGDRGRIDGLGHST